MASTSSLSLLPRNSVRLAIRKVMYAPSKPGEQPSVEVSKEFMMSPSKLHLECSLDKEVSRTSKLPQGKNVLLLGFVSSSGDGADIFSCSLLRSSTITGKPSPSMFTFKITPTRLLKRSKSPFDSLQTSASSPRRSTSAQSPRSRASKFYISFPESKKPHLSNLVHFRRALFQRQFPAGVRFHLEQGLHVGAAASEQQRQMGSRSGRTTQARRYKSGILYTVSSALKNVPVFFFKSRHLSSV